MGRSHALAYHRNPGFEIVGLVNRSTVAPAGRAGGLRHSASYSTTRCATTKPDVVSINTYSDSHADYAVDGDGGGRACLRREAAGDHRGRRRARGRGGQRERPQAGVGYILRHHPSWMRLIAEARKLGGPYVFRMNLNQQSSGPTWETHKPLMQTTSPIVDCGVHYVDVMCQITDARPVEVRGMGLRLSDEIAADMYNYGHLQVLFEDGSVGWYEAGWGPMMSETAFFVKDVISPERLRLDRHGRRRQVRRHRHPHQDSTHPPAPRRDRRGRQVRRRRTRCCRWRASPATRRSATASRPSC